MGRRWSATLFFLTAANGTVSTAGLIVYSWEVTVAEDQPTLVGHTGSAPRTRLTMSYVMLIEGLSVERSVDTARPTATGAPGKTVESLVIVVSRPLGSWIICFVVPTVLAVVTGEGLPRARVIVTGGALFLATRHDHLCPDAPIGIEAMVDTPPRQRSWSALPSTPFSYGVTQPLGGDQCGTTRPPGCTYLISALAAGKICGPLLHALRLRCMPAPTTRPMSPALRQLEGGLIRLGPEERLCHLPARAVRPT